MVTLTAPLVRGLERPGAGRNLLLKKIRMGRADGLRDGGIGKRGDARECMGQAVRPGEAGDR